MPLLIFWTLLGALLPATRAASEVLLRAPVPPTLARTLPGLTGQELLEVSCDRDGHALWRLLRPYELAPGSPYVLSGVVRATQPRLGRVEVGGYVVDLTPLMHDSAFVLPKDGELVTVTALQGVPGGVYRADRLQRRPADGALLTLTGITGSARTGITGSAGM